jgi:hypothetical protein
MNPGAESDRFNENPANYAEKAAETSPRQYVLSEEARAQLGRAFEVLAQLAPTLKEAELRVLIALARLFATSEHQSGRISSRKLAEAAKLARPNVQKAIDSLADRNIIATREGTATSPAGYALTFLRTTQIGGSFTMPPPQEIHSGVASKKSQGGIGTEPQEALFQSQGGSFTMPPPHPGQQQGDAGARVDSIDSDSIIDRLLKASPKAFTQGELTEARRWVHGYQLKYGREQNAHPPDDKILAQLLTAAPLPRLIALIHELMGDRKEPGGQYSWYVTVALQRIHGVKPETLKARRAALRIVRTAAPPAITGEQQIMDQLTNPGADPDFQRAMLAELNARRKAKGQGR